MVKELRKKDFKLGQLHGKFLGKNNRTEAHIRQTIFLSQKILLCMAKGEYHLIRVFGYEVPLKTGSKRGECVDLMGYDKEHNLYLVELKGGKSSEKLEKIAAQINGYEDTTKKIRLYIEKEFKREFFFHVRFKEIEKIVLAPCKFYKEKKKRGEILVDKDKIKYTYFADKDIHHHNLKNAVNIHLEEKRK